MKTSARNQFRGRVKSVRKGAVNADVLLDWQELGLTQGSSCVALIKASHVLLAVTD